MASDAGAPSMGQQTNYREGSTCYTDQNEIITRISQLLVLQNQNLIQINFSLLCRHSFGLSRNPPWQTSTTQTVTKYRPITEHFQMGEVHFGP